MLSYSHSAMNLSLTKCKDTRALAAALRKHSDRARILRRSSEMRFTPFFVPLKHKALEFSSMPNNKFSKPQSIAGVST